MNSDTSKTPRDLEEIDENLRKAYAALLNEDLPDRFAVLLDQLRSGEVAEKDAGEEGQGV
jgi:hypothetical protein